MKRLLLVDDDPAVLRALRRILSRHYDVDAAADAEGAAALLEQHGYDAVLTDFELPGRDGLWVLERTRERRPAARRVLTSANHGIRFDGAKVVEKFVPKPATAEQLLVALEG